MTHLCSRISNPAAPTKNVFETTLKSEHTRISVQQNSDNFIKPLTPELNPSAQRCLARFVTEDFSS
jgi:hypothetical protein